MMSLQHTTHMAHLAHKALEGVEKTENPLVGAGMGAMATGGGATAALALAGLALTPVGWVLALGTGAAAGASYVFGKKHR
jgi:hypothetical protein